MSDIHAMMREIEANPGTEPLMRSDMRVRFNALRDVAARTESQPSDEQLAEIEALAGLARADEAYGSVASDDCTMSQIAFYESSLEGVPALVAEIRRLRRRLQLSELSRGVLGQD